MEAKLYSPVFVDLWEYDYNEGNVKFELDQETAAWHHAEISEAIKNYREPEQAERGLMAFYNEPDLLGKKVHSLFVDVEVHDDKLWAVTSLKLTEPLTKAELSALRDYIEEQFADGFGEAFEQQNIKVEDGDLNVHLWKNGEFYIKTQEQFAAEQGLKLPPDVLSQYRNPAQAALYEPDASDNEEVAALREQLIKRLDINLSDYFDSLRKREIVTDISSQIASVTGAHYYLSEMHNFHTSELNYLLQFKEPLKVAADEFAWDIATENRSETMLRVFDKQETQRGDYELAESVSAPVAEDLSELRQRLTERAEENWLEYRNTPHNITPDNIYHQAVSVVGNRDAVQFIKNYDKFTAEQLNCLLQFANPVDLVAGYLDPKSDIEEMPGIVASIMDDQEHLKKHYALANEPDRLFLPAEAELVQTLADRLDENFAEYKAETLRLGKTHIFNEAAEITAVQQSYEYFRNEHMYTIGQAEFLMKLANPLELMSDRWGDGIGGVRDIINAIFNDQERTLQSGSYTLASDKSTLKPERGNNGTSEKLSVIEEIRQSQRDAQRRTITPNETPGKKKSEPDL